MYLAGEMCGSVHSPQNFPNSCSVPKKKAGEMPTGWVKIPDPSELLPTDSNCKKKTHPSIAAPKKDRQVICYFRFLRSLGCSQYCSWQQPPYVLNSMTPQKKWVRSTFYIGGCHFGWWLRICFTNMIDIYWPSYNWLVIHSNPSFTWLTFEWRV